MGIAVVILSVAAGAYLVWSGRISAPPFTGEPNVSFRIADQMMTVSGPSCSPTSQPFFYRVDFELKNNGTADGAATLAIKHRVDDRTFRTFQLLAPEGSDENWRYEFRTGDCLLPIYLTLTLTAVENLEAWNAPRGPRISLLTVSYGGVWIGDCSEMWSAEFLVVNVGDASGVAHLEAYHASNDSVFSSLELDAPARAQSMHHHQVDTPSCDLGDDLALRLAAGNP